MSRPVVIPIEDALDLHAFAPREIPSVVESYLEAAVEAGFREVRLIHGRGRGVQRRRVHEVLAASPLVERFADAPPGAAGGARRSSGSGAGRRRECGCAGPVISGDGEHAPG